MVAEKPFLQIKPLREVQHLKQADTVPRGRRWGTQAGTHVWLLCPVGKPATWSMTRRVPDSLCSSVCPVQGFVVKTAICASHIGMKTIPELPYSAAEDGPSGCDSGHLSAQLSQANACLPSLPTWTWTLPVSTVLHSAQTCSTGAVFVNGKICLLL